MSRDRSRNTVIAVDTKSYTYFVKNNHLIFRRFIYSLKHAQYDSGIVDDWRCVWAIVSPSKTRFLV